MTLFEKIKALHPELTDRDFATVITLQNDSDGKGDYIAKWEHPTLPADACVAEPVAVATGYVMPVSPFKISAIN